jgi:hypothetical protein
MLTVPLLTLWVFGGHVDEPHVEEGGEDEGEKGDGGAAHQVQDGPEVGQRLRDEQQAEYGHRAEQHALPVECCKETLKLELLIPFLFIKNKWVSPLLKKRPDMLSEGNAAHPVRCDSPLQIVMAVWPPFFLIQTFWVRCDSPLLAIMVTQMAITICRGLSHPTRSLSRIVCRG